MLPKVGISGQRFVVDGQPFVFRGLNIRFDPLHYHESGNRPISTITFDMLKNFKVNILRVWLNMEMACPSAGQWSSSFFSALDTLLTLAEQYNIYLLLSNSQYGLSKAFGSSYTGLPAWMFQGITNVTDGMNALYNNATIQGTSLKMQDVVGEFWRRVCSQAKARNVVMGYDIFNEPGIRGLPASYFLEDISAYISAIDPEKPQAVENNFIDNTYKPKIPNLFCAPHGYAGHSRAYSLERMKTMFRSDGYYIQGPQWNVPTINSEWFLATQSEVAEWGLTDAQIAQWYDIYIRAMEEVHGTGWIYLQCESSIENLHWNSVVKPILQSYFALNSTPPPPPPPTGGIPPILGLLGLVWLFLSTRK